MKIYFTGSITGNTDNKENFFKLMDYLKKYGEILTESIGCNSLNSGVLSLSTLIL